MEKKTSSKNQLLIKDGHEEAFISLDPSCVKVLTLSCGEELKFCNLQWINIWRLLLYPNFLAWTQHQFLTRKKKKTGNHKHILLMLTCLETMVMHVI